MWQDLVGKTFVSYPSGKPDTTAETFVFKEEPEGRFSTNGSTSGKNVYNVDGKRLVHVEYGEKVVATLEDAEFVWSHGYRSRPYEEV